MELSEAIKQARLELGLSQEGLACEFNVSFATANKWENKATGNNKRSSFRA